MGNLATVEERVLAHGLRANALWRDELRESQTFKRGGAEENRFTDKEMIGSVLFSP